MAKVIDFLHGKKTYLVGFTIFILGGLEALGYADVTAQVYTLLTGLGLVTLRAGVAKAE